MPVWGLALAVLSPLTYFTDLIRHSFTGDHFYPVWTDIAAGIVHAGVHGWHDIPAQEDDAEEVVGH